MIQLILNALPPVRGDTPSAALSILKGFMLHHHIQTKVIYWNLLLDHLLPTFEKNTDTIHFDLLPYLYWIAGEHDDPIAQGKANAVIKAQLPIYDFLNDNSDYLAGTKGTIQAVAAKELARYSHDGPMLFGIPCKYEQWIPGIVLGKYIKDRFPGAKIVIGGLRNRDKAESVMRTSDAFDFAIWGEGEYPLLELCRAIDEERENLASVPRLIFRKHGSLMPSDADNSRFYDMNSGVFPDYDDYFEYLSASNRNGLQVILPLESSRGCAWNACRFCVYGEGYKNRKKDPGVLKKEIRHLLERYDIRNFAFMDNDIVANDPKRLERILDDLITIREDKRIEFIAEIVHKRLKTGVLEKFPRAGLGRVHFGYESLTDRLLAKMKKRTNFSDNIFFVKFAHKYGIKLPSANIICGVIGEEDRDILESIDNLHFLRFYFDKALFCHNLIPLRIAKNSDFYKMIAKGDLIKWDDDAIFHLVPERMVEGIDRFSLFDFSGRQSFLWGLFSKINDFYYDHTYSYSISRGSDGLTYREFFDGEPVIDLLMNDLAYRILSETNSSIMDFASLLRTLKFYDAMIDERSVCIALDRLKEKHIVYFGDNYGAIVSVIDVDRVNGFPAPGAVTR